MAITGSQKAYTYALGGVLRGGAGRGGYTDGRVYVAIGGIHYGFGRAGAAGIVIESLTITDVLDETPNRAAFRMNAVVPAPGEIVITLGSKNNLERLFAGFLTTITERYAADNPRHIQAVCSCVDYGWLFSFVKVTANYRNLTATAIARDLVATYGAANGFTATAVAEGLPLITEITFTNEDLGDALTRIARRIGGYWYVDYHRNVHLFLEEIRNGAPVPITPDHKTLKVEGLEPTADRTQALTRVFVEGRGSRVLGAVLAGDTMIPIETIDPFAVAADVFLKVARQGSEGGSQHLNFAGVVPSAGGSLVGPGIGPPGAPGLAPVMGAGLTAGRYQYAYTFATAAGETVPSPIAAIDAGALLAPPVSPVAVTLEIYAGGVDRGTHWWTYTYASAGGETTGAEGTPANTFLTVAPPAAAPGADPTVGAGLAAGSYQYAFTFASPSGETLPSPLRAVAVGALFAPPATPITAIPQVGIGVDAGDHWYTYTFASPSGETTIAPVSALVNTRPIALAYPGNVTVSHVTTNFSGGGLPAGRNYNYKITYLGTAGGETVLGTAAWTFSTPAGDGSQNLVQTPSAPQGVAAIRVYRGMGLPSGGPYYLVGQVAPGGQFYEGLSDAALVAQPQAPATTTALKLIGLVSLSGLALGPAGTVARKIYRTRVSDNATLLLATIANNTATTYVDTTPDASLGAAPPGVNTAGDEYRRVSLSNVAIGGAGVTSRKIYRTAVNGSQLKLLSTWADNTTTIGLDATPDSGLGVNAPAASIPFDAGKVSVIGITPGPAGTVARKIYRTRLSDNSVRYVATLAGNVATTYLDTLPDSGLGALLPGVNTAGAENLNVQLSNIAAGPASSSPATTSRKIYRTAVNGSQLKLAATLADNITTAFLDAVADAALGANAPIGDTSGLLQPAGQVPAGSSAIIVANVAVFSAAGGWAVIGNGDQIVRYTGRSATAITGLPAAGIGAIVAAISYNSTITAAPMLTGIPAAGLRAIREALSEGDEIYIVVQLDDPAAAAELAAALGGGPGIREEWVQDRRLSITEARARGKATLAIRPVVARAIRYRCRDLRTAAGKTITVDLPAPASVSGSYKIQQATIANFRPIANQYPTYTVEASSARFTFEDFLRRMDVKE